MIDDLYQRSMCFSKLKIFFSIRSIRLPNLFEDSELLHTHIHTFHREYAGRSENEYSSGLFLHDLTRGSLLNAVRERVSSMTPAQCWIRPPNVSFKGEPGLMIVVFVCIQCSPYNAPFSVAPPTPLDDVMFYIVPPCVH